MKTWVNMLRVKDIRDMFKQAYRAKEFTVDRTGVKTIEVIGATFLADEDHIIREPNREYIERELLWYKSMSRNVHDIPGNVPAIWKAVADRDGMINSNYGWCIWSEDNGSQYQNVLDELRRNPDTRRASMIYNRPSMHTDFNRDGMNDFMCFPGNTLVLSPEGDITIKELVHKIQQGEKYPVYSVNFETEEREIKYAVNGAKTGKKEIIRVHFDNGKYIDSTPDHRFYVRERHHSGKQYYYTYDNEVKAIDLKPGMSMIKSLIYKNGKDHLRFKKLLKGEFSYSNSTIVHREYYKFHNPNENIDNMDIHHINENPIDNSINNLKLINPSEHRSLHQVGERNSVFKIKDRKNQLSKMVKTLKQTVSNRDISWYENKNNVSLNDVLNHLDMYVTNNNNPTLNGYRKYCKELKQSNHFTVLLNYLRLENLDFMDVALQNCKVSFVEKLYIEQDVYDIEVEDNHNFFVGWKDDISGVGNGVLVHNCTFANTFYVRSGKLISHYVMRSNDSVFGYGNDYAWAKYVQEQLARDLSIEAGDLIWTASNIHVYERHFKFLED